MEKIDATKRKKLTQAINFLEELSWLLDSKKNIEFKEIPALLRMLAIDKEGPFQNKYASTNSNKNYLIGVLPNLFQDEELFKTTSELIDFAVNVLHISISKAAKRSRYEYIGLIVCEVTNLNDEHLSNLVTALSKVAGSKEGLKQIKEERKKANFSWNETIHRLNNI